MVPVIEVIPPRMEPFERRGSSVGIDCNLRAIPLSETP